MELNLDEIRKSINETDNKLVELYIKRLALCDKVADYKLQNKKPVLDKKRENAIIERLTSDLSDDIKDAVTKLYKDIFLISRTRQSQKITDMSTACKAISDSFSEHASFPETANVACQGTKGAYSSIACGALFENPSALYFEDFKSVFKSVNSGLCQYGVLPFENSIYGSVCEVYDMLSGFDGYVVRSAKIPVHHALLASKNSSLKSITEVFSHKQAIGQCSIFLGENKNMRVQECENTAIAARMVAESGRDDIAAICSENCAEKYGLSVLKKNIQNSSLNFTVFYCISKELRFFDGINKISFMFTLENKTGSLGDILSKFSYMGVNLTKIESRPISGRDFDFMFYAEADIQGYDEKILKLLSSLEAELSFFKLLGAYKEITLEA